MSGMFTTLRLLLPLLGAAVAGGPSLGSEPPILGTTEVIRDFLIQNVCEDAAGDVLQGVDPADADSRCVTQRDLRPGEPLPYHKHDHPSPDQRMANAKGYQRHDSFPVETSKFGLAIEQSFDFGTGPGRRFGEFDADGDGGDIIIFSPHTAAIAATEDGGAGFQLFAGPDCHGALSPEGLVDSWIVAAIDGAQLLQGHEIARLRDLKTGDQTRCPDRLDDAYTAWRVEPFHYRASPGQGREVTLTTLISEHFAGADPRRAKHAERFYYTRELGSTRWERWENTAEAQGGDVDRIRRAASAFAVLQRCGAAPPPGLNSSMLMVDCREWTLIVPRGAA